MIAQPTPPSPLLPCRFMTSSDAAQSSGAQVPSLQSLSLKTHSVWPLLLMCIIHEKRSDTHVPQSVVKETSEHRREWRGEKLTRAKKKKKKAKTRVEDEGTISLQQQSKRETIQRRQNTCSKCCSSIRYDGHLQAKIKWPLRASASWPTPLLLSH